MKEAFYEESASCIAASKEEKFYKVCQVLSYVFLAVAAFSLFLLLPFFGEQRTAYESGEITKGTYILSIVQWLVAIAFAVGIFLFFFFFKKRYNVSYDYIFVEDELRIAKVFNGKKRKLVRKLEADRMLKIGWVKNESFERTCAGYSKKDIMYCTPNRAPAEGKEFFYLVYASSVEKKVFVIEARTAMLDYVVRAAGMNKLERK